MTAGYRSFHFSILPLLRPFKQRRFARSKLVPSIPVCTRPILLIFLVLLLFLLQLRDAYTTYGTLIYTDQPRTSHVDRSLNFVPPPAPIPVLYERHVLPWRKYPDLHPTAVDPGLSPATSRHRYLVSSAGRDVGDDLGERFLVLNYERALAPSFNLTYVHRSAQYGTLTAFRRHAVDRFFGWSRERGRESRGAFLRKVCAKKGKRKVRNGCSETTVFCKRLIPRNGIVERLVQIPVDVAACFTDAGDSQRCMDALAAFAERYSEPHTMFYTPTKLCSRTLTLSDQRITHSWFFNRYWPRPRTSRLDPRFVNIAVHVRRGNFLHRRYREPILDTTYAKVIRRIASIVSEEELEDVVDPARAPVDLKFKVHVYSQGLFQPRTSHPVIRFLVGRGLFGRHNVNDYGTKYVSEQGVETPDGYWERLLGNLSRISVDLHVSEDTLEGVEQMIAADVFVGSDGPLSVYIAAQLSRGIPFLPVRPPHSLSSNRTIRWGPYANDVAASSMGGADDPYFDLEAFRKVWREYRQHIGADKTPLGIPVRGGAKAIEEKGWLRGADV